MIVQTLNRIMITGKIKEDKTVTAISRKLIAKIDDQFSLKHKTIEKLLKIDRNISLTPAQTSTKALYDGIFYYPNVSVINHPVHMYDEEKKQSPSALIPFCAFGNIMHSQPMTDKVKWLWHYSSLKAKLMN